MTPWYKNPRDADKYADKTRDERVVFEGIYMANCANQGEIMLCMVEEKLLNIKTVSADLAELKQLDLGCRENTWYLHRHEDHTAI